MAINNFGLGSRDMGKAGTFALKQAEDRKEWGAGTTAKYSQCWQQFTAFAKDEGVRKMEFVTHELVQKYGKMLGNKVAAGQKAAGYAQDQLSAVNRVMDKATFGQFSAVSPTKECGIPHASACRDKAPAALNPELYFAARNVVLAIRGERAAAIIDMCRFLGMREKEASLINARKAVEQAIATGAITLSRGCKNGLSRTFTVTKEQIAVLERAAACQGAGDRSMIPSDQSWKSFAQNDLRDIRETLQTELRAEGVVKGEGVHDLRAAFACEKYHELTGHAAPCCGTEDRASRMEDRHARAEISIILGHERIEVVNEYTGSWGKR